MSYYGRPNKLVRLASRAGEEEPQSRRISRMPVSCQLHIFLVLRLDDCFAGVGTVEEAADTHLGKCLRDLVFGGME